MSSTTDRLRALLGRPNRGLGSPRPRSLGRRRSDGQVLVIFAFGIVGILAVAALVFDVGQNLFERRKQQDAADASALAGARWLRTTACIASSTVANCPEAYSAAMALAQTHGYPSSQITVNIPPTSGPFAGLPGHLQVVVGSNRGSYFAGVVGITSFKITASAVAANISGYPLPFSILSLKGGDACKAGRAHGNGSLVVEGDIQVASTCTQPGALSFDGTGSTIQVSGACSTGGEIDEGTGNFTCGTIQEHAPPITDPLAGLAPPTIGSAAVPKPPAAVVVTGPDTASNKIPAGCPGSSSPATAANPKGCAISFNRDKVVWIYPGVYYGGLQIKQSSAALTVYMAPGIYYMAGGGFEISGQPTVRTVEAATATVPFPTTFGGGALIYNTEITGSAMKAIDFQNTTNVQLHGYTGATYTGMLIWQDRRPATQPAMAIQGSSTMTLKGTIYLPKADFSFTGNGGTEVLDAQVICDEFDIGGNGDVRITYNPDDAVKVSGVGLVQ